MYVSDYNDVHCKSSHSVLTWERGLLGEKSQCLLCCWSNSAIGCESTQCRVPAFDAIVLRNATVGNCRRPGRPSCARAVAAPRELVRSRIVFAEVPLFALR